MPLFVHPPYLQVAVCRWVMFRHKTISICHLLLGNPSVVVYLKLRFTKDLELLFTVLAVIVCSFLDIKTFN